MLKVTKSIFSATISVMLLFPGNTIAEGVDQGEFLASMCVICHGYRGQGSKRIPSLDDHTAKELIEYMQGFKPVRRAQPLWGVMPQVIPTKKSDLSLNSMRGRNDG